jgi:hypothetical protein
LKLIAKAASGIGLILTVGPSVIVFQGAMELDSAKLFMLVGTLLWFASAPVWMNTVAAEKER